MVPFRWMALAVFTVFYVGCGVSVAAPTPPAAATPTISFTVKGTTAVTNTPSPTMPASPTGSGIQQSYTDPIGGYAIDIPRGWTTQDVDSKAKQTQRGYSVTFLSWEQKTPWQGELPAGAAMLQVTLSRWEPLDLGKYVAMRKEAWVSSGVSIVSEEEWTLAGNLRATRFIIKADKGNEFVLFALIKDHFVAVSGKGDISLLTGIARTLRPLSATP